MKVCKLLFFVSIDSLTPRLKDLEPQPTPILDDPIPPPMVYTHTLVMVYLWELLLVLIDTHCNGTISKIICGDGLLTSNLLAPSSQCDHGLVGQYLYGSMACHFVLGILLMRLPTIVVVNIHVTQSLSLTKYI